MSSINLSGGSGMLQDAPITTTVWTDNTGVFYSLPNGGIEKVVAGQLAFFNAGLIEFGIIGSGIPIGRVIKSAEVGENVTVRLFARAILQAKAAQAITVGTGIVVNQTVDAEGVLVVDKSTTTGEWITGYALTEAEGEGDLIYILELPQPTKS
jgi:uncharacterized membrane protein